MEICISHIFCTTCALTHTDYATHETDIYFSFVTHHFEPISEELDFLEDEPLEEELMDINEEDLFKVNSNNEGMLKYVAKF